MRRVKLLLKRRGDIQMLLDQVFLKGKLWLYV